MFITNPSLIVLVREVGGGLRWGVLGVAESCPHVSSTSEKSKSLFSQKGFKAPLVLKIVQQFSKPSPYIGVAKIGGRVDGRKRVAIGSKSFNTV